MNASAIHKTGIGLYGYKVFSLLSLGGALYLLNLYSGFSWLDISILIASLGGLFWNYKTGFFLLAVLLPVLEKGTWTGNILFGEYDILFLLVVCFLFWNKKPSGYRFKHELFFFFVLFWFLLCSAIGFSDYTAMYSVDDIYQGPFNSVRVGKGFVAAWLIWYLSRDELITDARTTSMWLGSGVLCGLFLLALAVLWERHVFSVMLNGGDIYALLAAILDFSDRYRVTGLFSGMHVGGTALDGYLVSVLPLVFYILIRQKSRLSAVTAISVFGLGVYCILVTFTRMTIASFSFSFLVSALMFFLYKQKHESRRALAGHSVAYFMVFVAVIPVLAYLQKQAGYQAFASGILVFFAAVAACYYRKPDILLGVGLVAVFLCGAYGINDSIRDSQWHQDTSAMAALIKALTTSAVLTVLGALTGKWLASDGLKWQVLGLPAMVGAGLLIVIVGMGSAHMASRMQTVSADLQTRKAHWSDVIDSAQPDSIWRTFWGFGMGSMPKLYYQSHFDKMPLPSYRWSTNDSKTVLEIGKGDFPYYQKLVLEPGTNYTLSAMIKYETEGGRLGLAICRRHILYSEEWQPGCVYYPHRELAAGWQRLEWTFNSADLGGNGWLDWPPTLHIRNYGDSVVAIDSVRITDSSGTQIVKNPDFDDKLKHWFWGSDFEHLPWHSKQIFVQIWLEQGWIGLLLFGLLIILGISHQYTLFRAGESIPIALIPSVLAILGLGLTDSFIDEPQTALMTFGVLFAALQWPQTVTQSHSHR